MSFFCTGNQNQKQIFFVISFNIKYNFNEVFSTFNTTKRLQLNKIDGIC